MQEIRALREELTHELLQLRDKPAGTFQRKLADAKDRMLGVDEYKQTSEWPRFTQQVRLMMGPTHHFITT